MEEPANDKIHLIDEGGYGCVFYPGINCQGTRQTPNFVTKIQKINNTLKNEISISEKIRMIKGYMKYFAPIITTCPVKLTKSNNRSLYECSHLQNTSKSQINKYVSNKIRYLGKVNIGDYIKTHSMDDILETHIYLLKGLNVLTRNGIIHFDIKYNNIMYDTKLKVPIIIDYGLSIYKPYLTPNNYNKYFFIFMTYTYWCIDILICNYIFQTIKYANAKNTKITKAELDIIYSTFISGIHKGETVSNYLFELEIIPKTSYASLKTKYESYFDKYIGKTWFQLYEELIKFSSTWDNYSLAMVYLIEINNIYKHRRTLEDKNEFVAKYLQILENIVFSMPDERPTLTETIKQIKSL
jgi:serine/threonine protein kinase